MSLTVRNGVASFEKGAGEWLLVREDRESSALQHVAELDEGGVNGKELEVVGRVARFCGHCSSTEEPQRLETTLDDLVDRASDGLGARVRVDAQFGAGDRVEEEGCFRESMFCFGES